MKPNQVFIIIIIISYASLSKIQQEFICKPHAVLGQGVLIFQTTASNYMNEDIDHSFLVPSACIRSHSCFSSEFSFELPLGNIRTFFKCHLFWSQGVSQLQGDGVRYELNLSVSLQKGNSNLLLNCCPIINAPNVEDFNLL